MRKANPPTRSRDVDEAPPRLPKAVVLFAATALMAMIVVAGPARASTGGSAGALGVDVDLAGLTLDIGGIEIPVLPGEPGVELVEAGTPPTGTTGNGTDEASVASISLFDVPPIEDVLDAQVVTADTIRTTSGLAAMSTIAGASVELLGTELVTTGAISSQVACPIEELADLPTGSTNVVDLEVAGVPVAINSVDIPVAVDLDVPGVVSAQLLVSVTDELALDATSADAAGLRVTVTASVTGVGGIIVGEGTVVDLVLAQSSCTRPLAMAPDAATIDPDSGPVGTPVTVTGTGFVPGATSIDFGALVVDAADVDVSGDGTTLLFAVPDDAPLGPTDVVAVTPGGETGPLLFTVTFDGPPTATGIDPDEGPEGTIVEVTGTGFVPGATSIDFGDQAIPAGDVDVAPGGETLTFEVPDDSPLGPTDVVVVTEGGESGPLGFTVTLGPPTVDAIDPDEGPETTEVTLTGDDFVPGATTVEFGELTVEADDVDVTDDGDTLTFVVPDDAPLGPTDVVVVTAGGETDPVTFTVTELQAPTATSLDPDEGPEGTVVTVIGGDFVVGGTTVEFGELTIEADDVDVTDDGDTLTFVVPDDAPLGPTDVVVVTAGGETDPLEFTVTLGPPTVDGIDPEEGPEGTVVIVTGDDFVPGETTVEFGDLTIEADDVDVADDGDTLTFVVPDDAPLGATDVIVVTEGGESAPVTFTVVLGPPVIDGVDPDEGVPGTIVVIVGEGFVPGNTTVDFGGITIEVVEVSDDGTELSFEVPADATLGANTITVQTEGGTDTVVFTVLDPNPTTTTTTTTPTTTTTATPGGGGGTGGGTSGGTTTVSSGSLPRTGMDASSMVLVGLIALGLGATAALISRRRSLR